MNKILSVVENSLTTNKERFYFWIHRERYLFILEKIQEITKGEPLKILDIGCFPYHIGKVLEALGHTVYGISSYHEPIKNKNIEVLNIEKEKFPYEDNFFDLVLFNEVIEHLPQSPVIPLREMYRVTKKGGFLMVTTPNIARSINRGKLLLGKNIMYPIEVFFEEQGKGNVIYHRHNREYTPEELEILLKKTSWNIFRQEYFISYTPFRKREIPDSFVVFLGKYINYMGMRLFPALRDTLFILGKK